MSGPRLDFESMTHHFLFRFAKGHPSRQSTKPYPVRIIQPVVFLQQSQKFHIKGSNHPSLLGQEIDISSTVHPNSLAHPRDIGCPDWLHPHGGRRSMD